MCFRGTGSIVLLRMLAQQAAPWSNIKRGRAEHQRFSCHLSWFTNLVLKGKSAGPRKPGIFFLFSVSLPLPILSFFEGVFPFFFEGRGSGEAGNGALAGRVGQPVLWARGGGGVAAGGPQCGPALRGPGRRRWPMCGRAPKLYVLNPRPGCPLVFL